MKNKSSKSSLKKKENGTIDKMEKLIVDLSTQLASIPFSEIDGKINHALKKIVESLGVSRCAFWEISVDGTLAIISHQDYVEGDNQPNLVDYKKFPWVFQNAVFGDHVCINNLEELPEEAAKDKETLRLMGIKSFMVIPYYIGGIPIAGMTLASMKSGINCSSNFIARMKLIGEIITSALYRKRMEEKYRKSIIEAQLSDGNIKVEDFPLREDTKKEFRYEGIIGNSAAMKLVFSRMEQVAPTDSSVLITGETGTGKGVVARAIHELSHRKKNRIVMVNCAALTPTLIESELFGREKGAYTGSTEMQIGRFELADKGTLILDEITELPMDLQAKLLRAIQEGEFERLGSPRTIKVDVRILALTSKNLQNEVKKGRFRQDLYYRLNVFPINIPPLRERREDIPAFAEHFVAEFNREMQKKIKNIPKHVIEELMIYSWPGNVRELEHIIERAVIMTQGANLQLGEKIESYETDISEDHLTTNLAEIEKRHILKILEHANWRIEGPKGAAILLGLHPNTLRGRMQKLSIHLQKTPIS